MTRGQEPYLAGLKAMENDNARRDQDTEVKMEHDRPGRYTLMQAVKAGGTRLSTHSRNTRAEQAGQARPNVLFVYLDDLGYGDITCFNPDSRIWTPNIDRIAEEGISFTDAHTPAAICGPSRYGTLCPRCRST